MRTLLLILWLQMPSVIHVPYGEKIPLPQRSERTRGPTSAQLPQVTIVQDGPLTIPAGIFWKAFAGLIGMNVLAVGGTAKYLWRRHNGEVRSINDRLATTVTYDTYSRDKQETRQMTKDMGAKLESRHAELAEAVEHKFEVLSMKVDRHYEGIMERLAEMSK